MSLLDNACSTSYDTSQCFILVGKTSTDNLSFIHPESLSTLPISISYYPICVIKETKKYNYKKKIKVFESCEKLLFQSQTIISSFCSVNACYGSSRMIIIPRYIRLKCTHQIISSIIKDIKIILE